jgi:hypothetical protein
VRLFMIALLQSQTIYALQYCLVNMNLGVNFPEILGF